MKNHPGIPQKSNIEDTLALKKLVDTFSNLADVNLLLNLKWIFLPMTLK